jgi:D-arabinose 5-phosphate isomerase GutQ
MMERPAKRQRTSTENLLPTPPAADCDVPSAKLLDRSIKVLNVQAKALSSINNLYARDPNARQSLADGVDAIVQSQRRRGKLTVSAVGKSAFIAQKLVATCKSLGVSASFLHACEAAHGDLGDVRSEIDVVLFVSYSGKTPELLNLLHHLDPGTVIMAITSHLRKEECPLLADRNGSVLLPAPIIESEQDSFGVSAPTTSTTVALAVADMLALTVADEIHGDEKKHIFKRNHPCGAIGMSHTEVEELKKGGVEVSILELPSPSISGEDDR